MKIGRRLAIKILNASRFALGIAAAEDATPLAADVASGDAAADATLAAVTEPLDRALLATLADVVDQATAAFDGYDYTRALEITESFFWTFCDDYVELVKGRAYGGAGEAGAVSARATLAVALSTLLRLFAPFLPFVTEEVWSWWQPGSVHRARWPEAPHLRKLAEAAPPRQLEVVGVVLSAVRRAKSEAKVSMKAEVAAARVTAEPDVLALLGPVGADLRGAGSIAELALTAGTGEIAVTVELAPKPADA
jgi:valyl-tRNA synthetase